MLKVTNFLAALITQALSDERFSGICISYWDGGDLSLSTAGKLEEKHLSISLTYSYQNSFIWARAPGFLGQWFTSIFDHVVASDHIRHAYAEADGKPFTIPGIGKYKTFITNAQQLDEVERAPQDQLSFNPIVEQQLATHIIFHGFKFDPKDPRHTIPVHSLRVLFKKNIHSVIPLLKSEVSLVFEQEFENATNNSGWIKKQPFTLSQHLFERLTNVVMVGKELADDPTFSRNVTRFIRNSRFAQEILRWTPFLIGEVIGRILMEWDGAKEMIYGRIMELLWERISNDGKTDEKPLISFALMYLCKYPEYLKPLKEEIIRLEHEPENEAKYDSMILMDSFLKETSRLQPLLSFTMARKVLKPFTFADGTHVPKNNWICAPQHVMNLDEANYSSPHTFDPFRFVPSPEASVEEVHASKFTTPSHNFLYWSGPKRPCTGRYFVSVTSKMILAEFITSYEFKLENPNLPECFAWNHMLLPHPRTKILFRRKS
ncbi:predicted protein [Sclerotinia sclerotiorum 1980 UF-70]|uniref:Cytochrome P450 n=1 Tax=Sclerotinia sclerotiorum (strain ATCC 18683 / 1980 / Ss-1) TaxID=665079 RepID=A7F1T0_SCLS1|nr:predicted protein [Sclerotinia sclerotiorum 1980 UF-70]EDN95672.1 predicted protein [Sclerotinia sclerotiorum 1980 UF-70]